MALGLSLEDFKNQTLGGTYGNPPPIMVRNSGTYQGQCVSLVRQYIEAVYGIKTAAWGDAVGWWNNANVQKYFTQVTDGSKQDGDILVWGDDPGTWTGPAGHIAIWYQGKLLNQNFGNSLKVSTNNFFQPGYLGVLRLKGANMNITAEQVKWTYYCIAGVYPTDQEVKNYAGKDYVEATESIKTYFANSHKCAYDFRQTVDAQAKQIEELEKGGEYIPVGELFRKK